MCATDHPLTYMILKLLQNHIEIGGPHTLLQRRLIIQQYSMMLSVICEYIMSLSTFWAIRVEIQIVIFFSFVCFSVHVKVNRDDIDIHV